MAKPTNSQAGKPVGKAAAPDAPRWISARQRLADEIVSCAKQGLGRYYMEYPERLSDARSKDALDWSMRGVKRITQLLDNYDIRDRGECPEDEPPGAPKKLEGES